MKKSCRHDTEPVAAEEAPDQAAYLEQQEQMRAYIDELLSEYGKSTMTLEELRATLDAELGDISLSDLVIKMRRERY